MKHEPGEVVGLVAVHGGAADADNGSGSGRRSSSRIRERADAEGKSQGDPPESESTENDLRNAKLIVDSNLFCLICCAPFRQSTAFSTKNNFGCNYCGPVWKTFCRLLSPEIVPTAFTFPFDKYPLPFCTDCAKNVIGLAKMQEELEQLQTTIRFGIGEIRVRIKETEMSLDESEPELRDYVDTVEAVRSFVLRDPEPIRGRCKNNSALEPNVEIFPAVEKDEARAQLLGPLDQETTLPSAPAPERNTSEQISVKLEPSQFMHRFEYMSEGDDDAFDSGDAVGANGIDKTDPKVEALVKVLSARTRRNILRKRQLERKLKGRRGKFKRAPHARVIDTEDGKLLFLDVLIHQEEVNGHTKYKCDSCGALLKDLKAMRRHIRIAHKNGTKNEYRCNICGKTLKNVGSMPRHMAVFHPVTGCRTVYRCDMCGKILKSEQTLECHMALVHTVGVEKYKTCDICERPFRSQCVMKQHRVTHMNEEERATAMRGESSVQVFQCQLCRKTLSCASSLRQHMLIHEDVLPFTCEVCGWGFRHKCNLQAHLRIHDDEERIYKFKCEFPDCDKSYPTRNQLVNHTYSHRPPEEKPYKCVHPGCTLGFARSHDLALHRRTHTGERPYKCTMCQKTFARTHHVTRHIKTVHAMGAETTELITAEIIEPTSNMTIEFVITGAEGDSFTLPDIKL